MLKLEEIKTMILKKVMVNGEKFGDIFPTSTEDGRYRMSEDGAWVAGFWPGLNFLCYELSGNVLYLKNARASRHRIINRLYHNVQTLDHDIGFIFTLSCVADYKLTGNEEARQIALDAAKVLSERFNPKGKFIQAWNVYQEGDPHENKGKMIVDCMYNLPLLFWASAESGDDKYKNIAISHADTCAKYIVRPDYTTYHTYNFDPDTGEPKTGKTCQGYSDESCWARGQAWAIGGFCHAFRYTGISKYIDIAQKCADVFINLLEDDFVPKWDFVFSKVKGNDEPRDSSAAAIAAAGLLELSKHLGDSKGEVYKEWGMKILQSLYTNYTLKDSNSEGLLIHGCGFKPINYDVDCSLIYGDYFFTEGIAKLLGRTKIYW